MKITIIGAAGTLGSCAAFYIGVNKLADEIVMIDPWEGMLKAQWMDLHPALSRLDVLVTRGVYPDMRGSSIVVVTSAAPAGNVQSMVDRLPGNLAILKENAENIRRYSPDAIVITETNPVDALNYAMYLMSARRDQPKYVGYCLNDTYRFRYWAAQALGVKVSRVEGMVMGEHGVNQVLLFSTLKVDGRPVKVDEAFKRKLLELPAKNQQEMESLDPKRTYGWMSSMGTVEIIRAIENNTREVIPCNVLLQGEYGYRNTTCGVPAVIGHRGVEEIPILDLAADETEGLRKSIQAVSPQMRYVEEQLGIKAQYHMR
jgi:malate dehydrogenase